MQSNHQIQKLFKEIKDYSKFQEGRIESESQKLYNDLLFFIQTIPRRTPGFQEKDEVEWRVISDLVTKIRDKNTELSISLDQKYKAIKAIDEEICTLITQTQSQIKAFEKDCESEWQKLADGYSEQVGKVNEKFSAKDKRITEMLATIDFL